MERNSDNTVIYRYYFRVIEVYIKDKAQLMDFLVSLQKKYRVLLNRNTTATIPTISIGGTLCGMISEVRLSLVE